MSKELWQQAEKPALLLSNICCQVASKFFNSVFVSCLMQTKPPSKKPTVFSLPLPFPKRKKKNQGPSIGKDLHILEKFITTDDNHYDTLVLRDA